MNLSVKSDIDFALANKPAFEAAQSSVAAESVNGSELQILKQRLFCQGLSELFELNT